MREREREKEKGTKGRGGEERSEERRRDNVAKPVSASYLAFLRCPSVPSASPKQSLDTKT